MNRKHLYEQYDQLLDLYLNSSKDSLVDQTQEISEHWISNDVSPRQAMAAHINLMQRRHKLPPIWEASFEFMLEFLKHYGYAYKEKQLKEHQIMEELSLAASLQKSLLPDVEKIKCSEGIQLGVVSRAARKVSGDFYNIYASSHGMKLTVSDVSGKSMPAAIFMSMIKFAMDSLIETHHHPHVALSSLNRFIHNNSEPSMFITMFWGEYDAMKQRFYYSSAGHEPALFYKAKRKRFYNLTTDDVALGLSNRFPFHTKSVKMEEGDFILLYTDGVIETRTKEVVDDNRLLRKLLRSMDLHDLNLPAQSLVDQLYEQLTACRTSDIEDDQTLLIFRKVK